MAEDLHMSGLAQLRMPFEVAGQGGELAFWLMDEAPDGKVRAPDICPPIPFPLPIPPGCDPDRKRWMPWARTGVPVSAHGQMNLRYYAGGEDPQTLAPATRYVAQAEFEPAEILVPAGHRLLLYVFQYHFPDHQSSQTYAPITVYLGEDAKLRVPTIDLDPRTIFPVPGSNFPDRENLSRMYVLPPVFQPGSPAGLVEGVTDGVTEAIPVPVRTSPSSRNPLAPL
jgi:hypothetical protein